MQKDMLLEVSICIKFSPFFVMWIEIIAFSRALCCNEIGGIIMNDEVNNEYVGPKTAVTEVPEVYSDKYVGSKTVAEAPEVYSDEYIGYVKNRYDAAISTILRQQAAHEISPNELARRVDEAILAYNTGIYEHVDAVERIRQEETALSEFDSDLKEQLRIQRLINARIKERTRQLKEEQRNARLSQQLDKEKDRTTSLQEQLSKLEDSGQKSLQ